jgi:hypothetical protein
VTTGEALAFVGWVGAIAAVVSLAVAGIVAALTAAAGRAARRVAPAPAPPAGPSEEERAAIFAAVAAVCAGPHRIVHIADTATGHAWVAEGRARQHASHAPPHRPKR